MSRFNQGILIFTIITLACLPACLTLKEVPAKKNFSYLYNPSSTSLHPDFVIYHKNDSVSQVIMRIYSKELLFNQANTSLESLAEVKISYKLYNFENKALIDSATAKLVLSPDQVKEEMVTFIPIKAQQGNKYIIQIETNDLKRNSSFRTALFVDKTDHYRRQNYLVRVFGTSAPLFNSVVDSNTIFFMEYTTRRYDSLNVKYFANNFMPAVAPSINYSYPEDLNKPDSEYVVHMKDTNLFRVNKKGLYIYQTDTSLNNGIAVMYFGQQFPKLTQSEELFEPLRYITTESEYKEMERIPNKKLVIDNFWLKVADGNIEKARELLRIYYNRTYLANYYFTSYKEGWKTDRGLIYIIYGIPDFVYKSDNSERWVYKVGENEEELFFKFQKEDHPYTDKNYILLRSENLNIRWREAIESWRKGKIYSSTEDEE